jgi:hypothetical protein
MLRFSLIVAGLTCVASIGCCSTDYYGCNACSPCGPQPSCGGCCHCPPPQAMQYSQPMPTDYQPMPTAPTSPAPTAPPPMPYESQTPSEPMTIMPERLPRLAEPIPVPSSEIQTQSHWQPTNRNRVN